jgi:AcrR family transcriptional regulator
VILDYVIDVLSEHAEAGVRIGDIARETGTSTSSIYHFFTNREELIAGAEVERDLRSLIASQTGPKRKWLA